MHFHAGNRVSNSVGYAKAPVFDVPSQKATFNCGKYLFLFKIIRMPGFPLLAILSVTRLPTAYEPLPGFPPMNTRDVQPIE